MTNQKQTNGIAIIVAFAIVYLVWGSTYVANIIAIESIPPFLLVVFRLGLAGSALLFLSRFSFADLKIRENWQLPTSKQWRNLTLTSFLFLTVGLGAVVWAEQFIESGITALLVALEPLIVVLVLWGFDKTRPRWQAFVGVALGILGSIILVGQDIVIEGVEGWYGVAAIFTAITAWAFGSVLTSRVDLPGNRIQTAGWQMLIAGALCIPFLLFTGEYHGFDITAVTSRSWWAFSFLVIFGSIIAYSAFLYLLQNVSAEKVASSTYVHPIVALSLGVMLRGEVVSGQTILACAVMLAGVLFVNGNWGRRERSALVQPRQANASPLIVRRWSGRAMPGKKEALESFIEEVVLPDMRSTPGNLSAERITPFGKTRSVSIESSWATEEAIDVYTDGNRDTPKKYEGDEELIDRRGEKLKERRIG